MNCSERVPSYESICSFTCNTGYKLTSSAARICQSNGSWSGGETVCQKGGYCLSVNGRAQLVYLLVFEIQAYLSAL